MIKVGFCASYDWEMLKTSLPRVYDHADSIVISLDENQQTWSGVKFDFDNHAFNVWLGQKDIQKKIKIYKDNFYIQELTPLENDSRQRNIMAEKMGKGGWHIQIDSDEYFLNFDRFCQFLHEFDSNPEKRMRPINICCFIIPIIKKLKDGYLFVPPNGLKTEKVPIATSLPAYTAARRSGHFNYISEFYLVHETWARSEEDLRRKMKSWGHSVDFDINEYLQRWINLNEKNYKNYSNFHPLKPEVWQRLEYIEADNLEEFIAKTNAFIRPIPKWKFLVQNNRLISKIKALLG